MIPVLHAFVFEYTSACMYVSVRVYVTFIMSMTKYFQYRMYNQIEITHFMYVQIIKKISIIVCLL